jgi:hypothetical protein
LFKRVFPLTLALCATCASGLFAQDTRKVTEPHFPKACMTLGAELSAPRGILADDDEQTKIFLGGWDPEASNAR